MLYREAGQFKSTYGAGPADLSDPAGPHRDRAAAGGRVRRRAADRRPVLVSAIITPFLILALAALGLNILTGYAGQLSLGTAAFMAVGAFMAYNSMLRIPHMPILGAFVIGGLCAAAVGIVFGLPSLRIKGLYLAVATLACQFFVLWAINRVGWFSNYSSSGVITAQRMEILGYAFDTPAAKYLLTLGVVGADGARGEEPDAQRDRPRVHGGARHGRRRRA